jgi:hypothetical protein
VEFRERKEKKRKSFGIFCLPIPIADVSCSCVIFFGGRGAGSYVVIAYGPKLHKKEKKTS